MSDKLHKLLNELKNSLDELARIKTRSADAAGTWSAEQVRYDVQVARLFGVVLNMEFADWLSFFWP